MNILENNAALYRQAAQNWRLATAVNLFSLKTLLLLANKQDRTNVALAFKGLFNDEALLGLTAHWKDSLGKPIQYINLNNHLYGIAAQKDRHGKKDSNTLRTTASELFNALLSVKKQVDKFVKNDFIASLLASLIVFSVIVTPMFALLGIVQLAKVCQGIIEDADKSTQLKIAQCLLAGIQIPVDTVLSAAILLPVFAVRPAVIGANMLYYWAFPGEVKEPVNTAREQAESVTTASANMSKNSLGHSLQFWHNKSSKHELSSELSAENNADAKKGTFSNMLKSKRRKN